ncbi:magnesium chelatase subunit D [Erythrobacter sp. EC-HK427]|uniref:magnesium chelatase subunit D n=1 Tax=Erythrobacter sp. EC-HK427 TaxID=2038396 RepID=UPI0012530EC6|nr:magnesium chelatase subunit D [Erythrobacter sp. EC-HK427]VVT11320.1 Magnesium-chelatase 60 kDa subunit [Erythrobacter sp. EC-HK427]
MTHPANPLADALLAAKLLLAAPTRLRGMVLRGSGPARDVVLDYLRQHATTRRLPPHIDEARLLGGVDIAASLTAGKPVMQSGLLAEMAGGVLIAPMAERMGDALAGRLAQAMDGAADFALVLLDDGVEADERPPAALMDRVAFHCDLSGVTSLDIAPADTTLFAGAGAAEDCLLPLANVATALGIDSVRALLFAQSAAAAHAAVAGREDVVQDDVAAAARLVLAPRATRLPPPPAQDEGEEAPPPPPESGEDAGDTDRDALSEIPEDVILEAALAAIPPDVLEMIAGNAKQRRASGGGSGKRTKSKLRGKLLGARPGMPRDGARLALIDTLRAAVPFQELRRRERRNGTGFTALQVRKEDLRIHRFEERAASVTVFCVDASGSAAAARLAEAKGAVELILAQAYVKRSEVALIAFRKEGAELLLPPTRSLTRARRALAGLPGGGGTPLASGLALARELGATIASRGNTPFLVFLTDGSANIAADGTPGRKQAGEDAEAAAKAIASSRLDAVVIDISPRPRPDARKLAETMRARYLPLPVADAQSLSKVIMAAQPESAAA